MFFFIGGVQTAQKQIGTTEQIQCPSCGMKTQFEISKTYTYFHLFFIPVFRWNVRYLAKASCCGKLFELDRDVGRQFEKMMNPDIRPEHLSPLHAFPLYSYCPRCRIELAPDYRFCPFCGHPLDLG